MLDEKKGHLKTKKFLLVSMLFNLALLLILMIWIKTINKNQIKLIIVPKTSNNFDISMFINIVIVVFMIREELI